ncbi:hypothetical protein Dimus_016110 [Dionaea muscipula]
MESVVGAVARAVVVAQCMHVEAEERIMKIFNNLRKAEEENTKLKDEMQKLEDIFPLTSIPPKHPPLALVLTIQQIKRLAAVFGTDSEPDPQRACFLEELVAELDAFLEGGNNQGGGLDGEQERRDGDPPASDEEGVEIE